jgi:hypothetical protein
MVRLLFFRSKLTPDGITVSKLLLVFLQIRAGHSVTRFFTTYIVLEVAWHFTVCRIKDKSIKPCMFKQLGLLK